MRNGITYREFTDQGWREYDSKQHEGESVLWMNPYPTNVTEPPEVIALLLISRGETPSRPADWEKAHQFAKEFTTGLGFLAEDEVTVGY